VKERGCWGGVAEGLDDVAGEALEAIDAAPRRLPGTEVGGELVGRAAREFSSSSGEAWVAMHIPGGKGRLFWPGVEAGAEVFAPVDGQRWLDRVDGPAMVPLRRTAICSARLAFAAIFRGSSSQALEERGYRLVEPGEIAVVGGGDEASR
jgi:hypothetical protein